VFYFEAHFTVVDNNEKGVSSLGSGTIVIKSGTRLLTARPNAISPCFGVG
jgi:hypothetical protein